MKYKLNQKLSDLDRRISYAQSWNLAVGTLGRLEGGPLNDESPKAKKMLEAWQSYFYDKLVTELEDELENREAGKRKPDHKKQVDDAETELGNEDG